MCTERVAWSVKFDQDPTDDQLEILCDYGNENLPSSQRTGIRGYSNFIVELVGVMHSFLLMLNSEQDLMSKLKAPIQILLYCPNCETLVKLDNVKCSKCGGQFYIKYDS